MLKNEKGITLIALVVTIVVLLILAAITVSLAINNNGVYNRALEAQQATINAQAYDRLTVNKVSYDLDVLVNDLRDEQAGLAVDNPDRG